MKTPTGFLGTYFERDAVLRLERWVRIVAWGTLVVYVFEAGYNAIQSVYNAIAGGYPFSDWYFVITTLSRVLQGGVLFMLLQVAAKVLLILLDIEDNTRRAARANSKES